MSRRFTRGFTLIELLVVIAIIGILASVVLVSLQSARKKGNDTRVISGVQQIRTHLETNFINNTYPDLVNDGGPTYLAKRPTSGNFDTIVDDIIAQQTAGGLTAVYGSTDNGTYVDPSTFLITKSISGVNATGYAIYAKLPSDPTKAFCMDSSGRTVTAGYPGAAPSGANANNTAQRCP